MHEIENDYFYDFVKQYDPDSEYYIVGEVEYHLLTDNKPYEGLRSQRDNLSRFKKNLQTSGTQCFWGFSFIYNCIQLW